MTLKKIENDQVQAEATGDSPGELRKLFDDCSNREKDLTQAKLETARVALIRELSFPPQFPRAPQISDRNSIDLRMWCGDLYRTLTALLKEAPNDDAFWWWLAQWLRYESIREPEAILPPEVLARLTKDAKRRLGSFLQTDDFNVLLVRNWLPYTEPLVRKARWLREAGTRNPRSILKIAGYSSSALDLVFSEAWRSPVEFTCEWVARRTPYRAPTLRNSYSRLFGKAMFQRQKCSFCEEPAEDEFWAYGDRVVHCRLHKPEKLPKSQGEAWPADFGYLWWRNGLTLRRFRAA